MEVITGRAKPSHSNMSASIRKKTPGACENCREKRTKCNGCHPCESCVKKKLECSYSFAPMGGSGNGNGNELLAEKLDLILSRLSRLEQACGPTQKSSIHNDGFSEDEKGQQGLTQLNKQNGCFEYYGKTSAFVVALSLGKRDRVDDSSSEAIPPHKYPCLSARQRSLPTQTKELKGLDLNELLGYCDYVVPQGELRHYRNLREEVADRHFENFLKTIHIFLPLFNESKLKKRYQEIRPLFGDHRLLIPSVERQSQPQFVCLLYAILALGALYEDGHEDSSSWASWYFVQAQEMLGRYLDAADLELVQAAMLMVCP